MNLGLLSSPAGRVASFTRAFFFAPKGCAFSGQTSAPPPPSSLPFPSSFTCPSESCELGNAKSIRSAPAAATAYSTIAPFFSLRLPRACSRECTFGLALFRLLPSQGGPRLAQQYRGVCGNNLSLTCVLYAGMRCPDTDWSARVLNIESMTRFSLWRARHVYV